MLHLHVVGKDVFGNDGKNNIKRNGLGGWLVPDICLVRGVRQLQFAIVSLSLLVKIQPKLFMKNLKKLCC